MTEDPMKAERDWYDNTEFDYSKMRRTELRRTPGSGPRSTFAIRLDAEIIDQLREIAANVGIGPTQLVREWIVERVSAEHHSDSDSSPRLAVGVRNLSTAELAAALRPIVREIVAEQLKEAARATPVKRPPRKRPIERSAAATAAEHR
jgi:hypothetical protein